ncbi:MAG: carboxypeptidase regulatory-like domain-containing protein [Terriglobales bacterium]
MRAAALLSVLLTVNAFAADITGTVTNLTTNKPSAGDSVVLLKLVQGMDEVATAKTDAQGRFTLPLADPSVPHLIRVNHRNVNYFRSAPPGTTSVEINVYDAAEQVEGVKQTLDIMRLEGDMTTLRVIEMFIVENASKPPVTMMSMKSLEFQLPKGATFEQAMVAGPNSMPVTAAPVPQGDNRYSFLFPIRPGETRFQVSYTLPYSGSTQVSPILLQPVTSFAVSVPKTMKLEAASGSALKASGEEAGMNIFVAQGAAPGQKLDFTVSGTGTIPQQAEAQAQGGEAERGPGGGLGAPINTPNPLTKYQWWILAGVAVLMAVGAAFTIKAQPKPEAAGVAAKATPLDTFKEESFLLESERLQGKITEEEYVKAKAALDVVMKRALERSR